MYQKDVSRQPEPSQISGRVSTWQITNKIKNNVPLLLLQAHNLQAAHDSLKLHIALATMSDKEPPKRGRSLCRFMADHPDQAEEAEERDFAAQRHLGARYTEYAQYTYDVIKARIESSEHTPPRVFCPICLRPVQSTKATRE